MFNNYLLNAHSFQLKWNFTVVVHGSLVNRSWVRWYLGIGYRNEPGFHVRFSRWWNEHLSVYWLYSVGLSRTSPEETKVNLIQRTYCFFFVF